MSQRRGKTQEESRSVTENVTADLARPEPECAASSEIKSRARAKPVAPEEKRSRLERVIAMMARGAFKRGETDAELAEEWGVSIETAQGIAAEASRHAELRWGDGDAAERYSRVMLRRIAEMAAGDNPAAAVAAIKTLLQSFGRLHERVDVTVSALPAPELVAQAIRQAMASPELLELVCREILRHPDAVELLRENMLLLTSGEQ